MVNDSRSWSLNPKGVKIFAVLLPNRSLYYSFLLSVLDLGLLAMLGMYVIETLDGMLTFISSTLIIEIEINAAGQDIR